MQTSTILLVCSDVRCGLRNLCARYTHNARHEPGTIHAGTLKPAWIVATSPCKQMKFNVRISRCR